MTCKRDLGGWKAIPQSRFLLNKTLIKLSELPQKESCKGHTPTQSKETQNRPSNFPYTLRTRGRSNQGPFQLFETLRSSMPLKLEVAEDLQKEHRFLPVTPGLSLTGNKRGRSPQREVSDKL